MDRDNIWYRLFFVSLAVAILAVLTLGFTYDFSVGGYIGLSVGVLFATTMFGGWDTSNSAIGLKIWLLLCVATTGYFSIQAFQKFSDPDKYAMKVAKRSDDKHSYVNYLKAFPEGAYREAAKDSIAAKELQRTYFFNKVQFYEFIDTCSRPDIAARAHRLLDVIFDDYKKSNESPSKDYMQAYVRNYEFGPHYDELKWALYLLEEEESYEFALKTGTLGAYNNYLEQYPNGTHSNELHQLIKQYKQLHRYDGNYLSSGSQPYANVYGRNGSYNQCAIKISATGSTDVVVVVKHDNKNGRVAGHAYVHKGGTCSISLRPGTYQTFFYYGTSWNPNKKLDNGLTGGFMYDEQYGKDEPTTLRVEYYGDYVSYDQLSYSLQSVIGGNFSMKNATETDVF